MTSNSLPLLDLSISMSNVNVPVQILRHSNFTSNSVKSQEAHYLHSRSYMGITNTGTGTAHLLGGREAYISNQSGNVAGSTKNERNSNELSLRNVPQGF